MVKFKVLKQSVHQKEMFKLIKKIVLYNILFSFMIFISLSNTTISSNEKYILNELKSVKLENDSLKSIISEIYIIKNDINILKNNLNIDTVNFLMFAKSELDILNDIKKNYINIFDSIKYLPLGQPINISELKLIYNNFGYRKHPVKNEFLFHNGIDISALIGSNIFSTGYGYVEKISYSNSGYGNVIVINHTNNFKTVYAHLDKIFVKTGDIIKKDDIIGLSGNSGLTTGPHLHYEIIYNNKSINPIKFVYSDMYI